MISKTIYIIEGSSGSYEDAHSWNECAYADNIKALEKCKILNDELANAVKVNNEMAQLKNDACSDCERWDCVDCKWEDFDYDYNIDEQHDYRVKELVLFE